MQFIEMTGKTLRSIVADGEFSPEQLAEMNVDDQSVVRVNLQGDIEVRRAHGWDIIGGLLGNFEHRIKQETGMDWA